MRQRVLLGTRRLAYLEAGAADGSVLVWLHAFPLTADMFRPQLESPPRGWRLLAPDLPGLGGSDDHQEPAVALDDYARAVIGLLDALAIPRAVVGGVSLGGYAALAVARLAPDRLAGLILSDTKASPDDETAREGRARMLDVLSDRGADGVADEMLGKLVGETTRRERPEVVSDVRAMIITNDPEGIRRAILRLRDRPDATPALHRIAVPTLVLVGAEDAITPRDVAAGLAAAIPGASLHVVPAAGHLPNLENPAAFAAALAPFLELLTKDV